jgi:hypothetical protein
MNLILFFLSLLMLTIAPCQAASAPKQTGSTLTELVPLGCADLSPG